MNYRKTTNDLPHFSADERSCWDSWSWEKSSGHWQEFCCSSGPDGKSWARVGRHRRRSSDACLVKKGKPSWEAVQAGTLRYWCLKQTTSSCCYCNFYSSTVAFGKGKLVQSLLWMRRPVFHTPKSALSSLLPAQTLFLRWEPCPRFIFTQKSLLWHVRIKSFSPLSTARYLVLFAL